MQPIDVFIAQHMGIYISIVIRIFCGKLATVNKDIGLKNKVARNSLLGYLEDHRI